MRLLSFTPIDVSEAERERRQRRYDQLTPPGLTVELRNVGSSAPRALDSEEQIRASESALALAFRSANATGFDGFLPDCVLDPCAEEVDGWPVPMYGISRLAASYYVSLGHTLGALARNAAIATELDRRLAYYGVAADPTEILGLQVADLSETSAWAVAVADKARTMGCSVALNACSAVDLPDPPRSPRVVDPAAVALQLLALQQQSSGVAA